MLQKLRDKTTGWIATLILGLLIIPFAFVGVNEYMTGGNADEVAIVKAPPAWWKSAPSWWPLSLAWQHEEVSVDEFRIRYEQVRQQQREAQGDNFDVRAFESKENKLAILQQLIDQKVLALVANQEGVVVGDAAVRDSIASIPAFQVDGKFNNDRYQMLLASQVPAVQPLAFQEQQRERLKISTIPEGIANSDFMTQAEMDRLLKLMMQTRDVTLAMQPPVTAADEQVSDQDIKAWYESHASDYVRPETVQLEYLDINTRTGEGQAVVADEVTLRKRYETEKARFASPEQRVVSHILIAAPADADAASLKKAEDKAKALAEQAKQPGADFAALAKANSEDPGSKDNGGELPPFAKDGSMVQPFEDAAFAIQNVGDISGPVKSDFGYHVLKLDAVHASTGKSFEEVRDELAREQAEADAERAHNELAGRVVNEVLKNPTSLAAAAKATGLQVQRTEAFPRNAPVGIATTPAVLRAAFSEALIQDGTVSDPIEIAANHSVVIRVSKHSPEQALPLAQVRDDVIAAVRADRRDKAAEKAADALVARVQKGESLKTLAAAEQLQISEMPGVQRGMPIPSAEANAAIFAAQRPAEGKVTVGKVKLAPASYAVFAVNKVQDGDLAQFPEAQRQGMQQQLAQLKGNSAMQSFIDSMRKQYQVTVLEDRL